MLIRAVTLVASDKSRCYDDYLWVCGMIIKMTQYIHYIYDSIVPFLTLKFVWYLLIR